MILALCGYPTVGKDEIADYLCNNHDFVRVAFADPLRESLISLDPYVPADLGVIRLSVLIDEVGWTEAKKNPEVRRLLQRMGTEAGRDIHGYDVWVNLAKQKIDSSKRHIVVTDLRFDNELAMLRSRKALVAHVTRPGRGKVNNHASEQMNYGEVCDLEIANTSTVEWLHGVIANIVKVYFRD